MKNKRMPNIYIRQYQEFDKKKTRKSFVIIFILIIMCASGFFFYQYRHLFQKRPQQVLTVVQRETLSLYLPANKNSSKLIEKKVEINNSTNDKEKADIILKHLKDTGIINSSTVLTNLIITSDGIIYLNFSKDLITGKMRSVSDISTVYSIVNSFLGNHKNANRVQFLVDGSPPYTIGGTVFTYKPLEFNQDLLED